MTNISSENSLFCISVIPYSASRVRTTLLAVITDQCDSLYCNVSAIDLLVYKKSAKCI